MSHPAYWQEACAHLSDRDAVMQQIINSYQGEMLRARGDAFYTLARSIVGQQISVKAADTIWTRFAALIGSKNPLPMTPEHVLMLDQEALRACGLSYQKINYLQAIAEYFMQPPRFHEMGDDDIFASLISIKGVGTWTAEMFMIFHLLKPDVLPLGDVGLLKAIYRHYNEGEKMPLAQIVELATLWQPYRTVATWYLWRSLDPVPVEY